MQIFYTDLRIIYMRQDHVGRWIIPVKYAKYPTFLLNQSVVYGQLNVNVAYCAYKNNGIQN